MATAYYHGIWYVLVEDSTLIFNAEALSALDRNIDKDRERIVLIKQAKRDRTKLMNIMIVGQESQAIINGFSLQGRLPYKCVQHLKRKFQPEGDMDKMRMDDELAKLRLGKNENAFDLEEQIAGILSRYRGELSKKRTTVIVMRCGMQLYLAAVTSGCAMIRAVHERLAATEYILQLMNTERLMKGGGKVDSHGGKQPETSLPMSESEIKCNGCGLFGHKKWKCTDKHMWPKCAYPGCDVTG